MSEVDMTIAVEVRELLHEAIKKLDAICHHREDTLGNWTTECDWPIGWYTYPEEMATGAQFCWYCRRWLVVVPQPGKEEDAP